MSKAKLLWADSLHRNSLFMMMSTGILSAVGFFFWIIASRLYTTEQIGLGGSLISIGSLLIAISVLGFPETLIRFLPNSNSTNAKVSTAITLASCMSVLSAIIFLLIAKNWFQQIYSLLNSPWILLTFTFFIVVGSCQKIIESVFIAIQKTKWIMLESLISSLVKLTLVMPVAFLGAYGIFASFYIGISLAIVMLVIVLMYKYKVEISLSVQRRIFTEMSRFSLGNHVANTIGLLPTLLLPAIVTRQLGATEAAHFFLAQMMVNLLLIIPQASSQTLLAQASRELTSLKSVFIKSFRLQALLLSVGILMFWSFGGFILSFFGNNYHQTGNEALRVFALTSIPASVNILFATRLRVIKKMKRLIYISSLGSALTLACSVAGGGFGLKGMIIGFGLGQTLMSITYIGDYKVYKRYKN